MRRKPPIKSKLKTEHELLRLLFREFARRPELLAAAKRKALRGVK